MKDRSNVLSRGLIGTALLLAVVAAGAAAQSKVVTNEELARTSEVVAIGKVTATKAEWDKGKTRIVTHVTVAVDEYLKGNAGNVMTITSLGGEVDGVGELYSHTATFQQGERVLVFAAKDKHGDYRVSSGQQGKFTVRKDEATGKLTVDGTMSLEAITNLVKKAILSPDQN